MSEKVSPLRQPTAPASAAALVHEVAGLIVAALNLDLAPADIDADAPLYGEGLGLDSIDILEIALVVSKQYGVQLRADSAENERIFGSLRRRRGQREPGARARDRHCAARRLRVHLRLHGHAGPAPQELGPAHRLRARGGQSAGTVRQHLRHRRHGTAAAYVRLRIERAAGAG